MDIQTRKMEFVREFLKIQREDIITRFEKLLQKEKTTINFKLMSLEELNNRIDQSEADFQNGRHKSTAEIISKY